MTELQIKMTCAWQPVYLRENVEYLFPMSITPYMRTRYKAPAIFKWDIYQKSPGDKKQVYIGETQELCPQRLYSYLNPGPTQMANQKVNADFRGYLKQKLNIRLEICQIQEINFNGELLDMSAFADRHVRRLLSEALIVEHGKKGFTVVDL